MSADVVLYLGDKRPRDLGMRVLRESQRPITAPTVDTIVYVPYMHGAYDFGAYLGPRPFELDCALISRDAAEVQELASSLAAYLLDADGRPKTMPLILSSQPDRQFMVRYSGDLQISRVAGLGTFKLPFTAFDPFAYSTWDSLDLNVDSEVSVDSDILVDTGYAFTISYPQNIQAYNYGNQNIRPIIEISGSFASLSLTLAGNTFAYNASMSGGTLTVDFERKTAKIGGVSVLANTNARFGYLPVGVSDIIVGGAGLNFNMALKFKMKYA